MRVSRIFAGVAALGTVAALATPVLPADASHFDVRPGQSIQAAINRAAPGTELDIAPGVYRENLEIAKAGIELDGKGAVLRPPTSAVPNFCTDPSNPTLVTGICIHGTADANFNPTSYLPGVELDGLRVDGFTGDGVFAFATRGLEAEHNQFANNGGYGIFAFHSQKVTYRKNYSHDNGDAGFYVGESPDANVRIEHNRSVDNHAEGLLFRDSQGGKIRENSFSGNCAGIFALDTGAPGIDGKVTIEDNVVTANNRLCPGGADAPPFSGIGIGVLGTTMGVFRDNRITNNRPSGPSPLPSGGIVVLDTTSFGGTVPTGNLISDNRLRGNAPSDLFSDGSGTGNRFHENRCESSIPPGLCD